MSHLTTCPVAPRVDKLEHRASRFYFFEKYPAFTAVIIVVFGIVSILSFLGAIDII
jgi:hypothetical protein